MKNTLTQKVMFSVGIIISVLSITIIAACNNPTDDLNGEPAVKKFMIQFSFPADENDIRNYEVVIQDVRTNAGSMTLEGHGIVNQIKNAIQTEFDNAGTANKGRFHAVFERGVTIYVGNHPQNSFIGLSAPVDGKSINIHFNYLQNHLGDFSQRIITVIQHMEVYAQYQSPSIVNGMIINPNIVLLAKALDTGILAEGIFWQIGIETM